MNLNFKERCLYHKRQSQIELIALRKQGLKGFIKYIIKFFKSY